ncbi:MAG: hypothetical protein Fur0010_23930 [Bdellovibrio sp.]
MKKVIVLGFLIVLTMLDPFKAWSSDLSIIGNIPDRYIEASKGKRYQLGIVEISDGIITKVQAIRSEKEFKDILKSLKDKKVLFANPNGKSDFQEEYDFIFPGLIDLHNHTKQNNLGVWDLAKGQFKNRFEWRDWNNYKMSVSANMNPWIGFGKAIECAAFRWSELQAMVIGTTYLQGPSSCIDNFTIHQVEDAKAYRSNKKAVQAPTDLVMPGEMTFVWQELRPAILKGKTYEEALADKINESCELEGITAQTVNTSAGLKILKDQNLLKEKCTKKKLHSKFIRYVYWIHPTIASKKNYLKDPKRSALIAHLAEGRRDDPYNQVEFEIIKLLNMAKPNVNFVHGVGISKEDFKVMGKNKMGLIWSPYSNLLLYGQTLDVKSAKEAGVLLSLGSDWLPTGSRGVLEEVKLAASYVDKDPDGEGLKSVFTDEELYLMLTENPAQMINHFDINPSKGEHGIGQIKVGAMGTVITSSKLDEDPYLSLVRKTYSADVNAVVIDGKFIYGNENYASQLDHRADGYELLPTYFVGINEFANQEVPRIDEKKASKDQKLKHLLDLGKIVSSREIESSDECGFKTKKVLIHQNSIEGVADLKSFFDESGLNLDRAADIQKILGINMLSQSRNATETEGGKKEFAVKKFASLYSCNDKAYMERFSRFVVANEKEDEMSINSDPSKVESLRKEQKLGKVPEKLAKDYAR